MNNGFKENEIKLFSDNIFINFPNTTLKEMYKVFSCLAYIQIKAIEKYNFLLRGGVEYSTIYNEKDIVIGKGLVKAVELEKDANYPIIMLGERAKEEHLKKDDFINKQYIKDFIKIEPEIENMDSAEEKIKDKKQINGESIATVIRINDRTYINYLGIYYENENKENFVEMLLNHKKFIVKNFKKNKEEFFKSVRKDNNEELKVKFKGIEEKRNLITMAFLELNKYNPDIRENYNKKRWLELFSNQPFTQSQDEIIESADSLMEYRNWSEEEKAMYDEKTRKYDAYIDTLQYKYVEGIEQGRSEERENSIARFIKYVKLGVISKKDACQDLGMTEKELDKYLQA